MEEEKKKKKHHRRAAATAVAAVTSASVVMGGMFASPDDLLNGNDDDGGTITVTDTYTPESGAGGDDIDDADASDSEDESRRRGVRARARQWVWRLPYGVRAVIGVPLWALGWLIITGCTALWNGVLSPVFGTVLGWVLTAAVLLLAFALTGKALFPDLPLKKILNKRSFFALLIGTVVLALADSLIPLFWDGYAKIGQVVRAVGSAGLLGGVTAAFARRECRRRKKLAEKAAREAEKDPPRETMAQALRRAKELADSVRPSNG